MRQSDRIRAVTVIGVLGLAVAPAVWAQTESSDPGADEANASPVETIPVREGDEKEPVPADSTILEEIVVTATKRETSAREIAGSVSALSGQDLEDMGAQDIENIVAAVPGLTLIDEEGAGSPSSNKRITVRGISAGLNQVDTTGVFIDETSFTDPFLAQSSADLNPFDIDQVEVLKGPVGTLFGGSALNGAIRYIPTAPVFDTWEGKAFAEWRTFQYGGAAPVFGGAVNVPLGRDDLALRVVGVRRETAGYVDSLNQTYQAQDINGVDQDTLRAMLRWQPLDPLDLSLMYVHQDMLVKDYSNSTLNREGRYESTGSPQPSPSATGYDLYQFKGKWAFDWADLVAVVSHADKTLDGRYDQSSIASADPPSSVLFTATQAVGVPDSQELRLVSATGGDWDWLAGVFNYRYRPNIFSQVTSGNGAAPTPNVPPFVVPGGAVVGLAHYQGSVTEQAAFGELSWRFFPGLQLTGGLRFYRFAYDVLLEFDGPICNLTDTTCGPDQHSEQNLDAREQGLSPKLSLKWDPTSSLMFYATAARGFRFGGVNAAAHPEIPRVYESDSLWSYEIGTRSQWFDNTLVADATVFYLDWDDAQFQRFTSDGALGYTDNVGAVVGRGVEGQLIWLTPLPGIKLTAIAAYANVVTAEDFNTGAPFATTVAAGTRWPRSPHWTTTAVLDWTDTIGPAVFSAGLTHSYLGEALQNFGFPSDAVIFGYSTYGLQITAKPLAANWWWPELALNANNLTGKRGINYTYDGAGYEDNEEFAGGSKLRTWTTPRNISARLTFKF